MGRVKSVQPTGAEEGVWPTLTVLAPGVRHPTDHQSTFSCSPPPLARTQLLSVTAFRPNLGGTFTSLIQQTYRRTSAPTDRCFRPPIMHEPILNPRRKRGWLNELSLLTRRT